MVSLHRTVVVDNLCFIQPLHEHPRQELVLAYRANCDVLWQQHRPASSAILRPGAPAPNCCTLSKATSTPATTITTNNDTNPQGYGFLVTCQTDAILS